jgi:small subunit ribosomal protein S2
MNETEVKNTKLGVIMSHAVSIEQLLEAGAHFGHLTRRWNPKMEKFIFMERNGIHIIDLRKTQLLLDIAREAIFDVSSQGRVILFVGTKNLAKEVISEAAKSCKQNYVTERWLGGMLTNFSTIRKSIKRLNQIDKMEVDGTFEKITKKERLLLSRERDRLRKVFGGIEEMTRLPGALFVVDIKKEHIAIKEAQILGIPVIAIVDTNTDPEQVDYPIPANDDSIKTIELMTSVLAQAVNEGEAISRTRMAEMSADSERAAKESETGQEDAAKVQRRMRERRGSGGGGGGRGGQGGGRGGSRDRAPRGEHSNRGEDRAPAAE